MKKFKITVTRTDEYEIEVDETVWTQETLFKWSNIFQEAESPEDFAKCLAASITYYGSDHGIMEGFGNVQIFRHDGTEIIKAGKKTEGLSAKLLVENGDYECVAEEIS